MVAARWTYYCSASATAVAIHARHEFAGCKTGRATVGENCMNIHIDQLAGIAAGERELANEAELGSRIRSCCPSQNQDTHLHKE